MFTIDFNKHFKLAVILGIRIETPCSRFSPGQPHWASLPEFISGIALPSTSVSTKVKGQMLAFSTARVKLMK